MDRKLILIWDFKGDDGSHTAKHHSVHLKEFAAIEKLPYHEINIAEINEFHAIAYIVVDEKYMKKYRDALKPHRGELA